ncbi:hypothetical protein [Clostridium ganghwense]|uniref:Uncharacterized protein n=1 Tax=Clostridium ganghwense TaxID=312089 RepID=A0ABT4CUH1_9CLOT|nr:hypothetical protein [Clostridium ganghwense]MCY6372699.1 hypothetical protein [Clostridium ganghwense]
MGYNVLDVIDKLIMIKQKVKGIYINISYMDIEEQAIKLVATALAQVQEKHIKYYEELRNKIGENTEEIDFVIYDKISFLIDEYKNRVDIFEVKPKDIKEILNLAFDFENKNGALIIDIQGRLVKKESDVETKTYRILSEILQKEQSYIKELKSILEYGMKNNNIV